MITISPPDIGQLEAVAAALSPAAMQSLMRGLAESARLHWIQISHEALSTSGRGYRDSIQKVARRGSEYVISLVGQPAVIIEEGHPRVDMRKWLLGPNVPVLAPGARGKGKREHQKHPGEYYRSIPFRHGIPTAGGGSGAPMGSPYGGALGTKGAKKLGRDVYSAAQDLFVRGRGYTAEGEEDRSGGTPYGPQHPLWKSPDHQSRKSLDTSEMNIPLLRAHHTTDIYSGMIRSVRTPQDIEVGSMYVTFRRISTRKTASTDPASWIRGATAGKKLAPRVSAFVARMAPKTVQAYVEGIGT